MMDKSPENKGGNNLLAQYRKMAGIKQKTNKQTKEQEEGLGKNFTPLTPMETQMAKKPESQSEPQSAQQSESQSTPRSEPQSGPQSGPQSDPPSGPQSGPQSESTRNRQEGVNRVDQQGQQITPRLAQEERVPSEKPKSLAGQAAESSIKSAAKVLIPTLGSGAAGGIIAYLIT